MPAPMVPAPRTAIVFLLLIIDPPIFIIHPLVLSIASFYFKSNSHKNERFLLNWINLSVEFCNLNQCREKSTKNTYISISFAKLFLPK
jgi:hypothetical protein